MIIYGGKNLIKNLKMIKTTFIFSLVLISLFTLLIPQTEARDKSYNAFVDVTLTWSEEFNDEPIVPRDEIVELELKLIFEIFTGEGYGAGIFEGYRDKGSTALIDLYIVDYPPWCSAVLDIGILEVNISERDEDSFSLFIHVNEDAPAYTSGIIRIGVEVKNFGLFRGTYEDFNLTFKPAFFPIIKTNLPEMNTKKINPTKEAVFPIEIVNVGNAETKVFFKVLNVPKDWAASITDSIIIPERKGSSRTAILTVIPSRDIGYHYDEANIVVEILPAFSESIDIKGKPIYATFLIQNRGFSSTGLELYIPLAFAVFIIIVLINLFYIKKQKEKK